MVASTIRTIWSLRPGVGAVNVIASAVGRTGTMATAAIWTVRPLRPGVGAVNVIASAVGRTGTMATAAIWTVRPLRPGVGAMDVIARAMRWTRALPVIGVAGIARRRRTCSLAIIWIAGIMCCRWSSRMLRIIGGIGTIEIARTAGINKLPIWVSHCTGHPFRARRTIRWKIWGVELVLVWISTGS